MFPPLIAASFFCSANVQLKPEFEFVRSLKQGTTIEVTAIDQQTKLEFKCMFVVPKRDDSAETKEFTYDNT